MAQSEAKLYQRLRTKGFPWVPVREFHKNGTPKPHPEAFQFGVRYSLDGKRRLDPAATLDMAIAILKDRQVRILAAQNGVTLPNAVAPVHAQRIKIADAIKEYLTTGKAYTKKWSEDTLRCYRDSTSLFLKYCTAEGVEHTQGIDNKFLLRFKPFLRDSKDRYGFRISDRTVYNHFLNTVSFLNEYKVDHDLKENDWPTYEEKEVSVYSDSEFGTLLAAAYVEERDVLEFFFGVNFRNGEGAHTEWHDIDFDQKEVSIYSTLDQACMPRLGIRDLPCPFVAHVSKAFLGGRESVRFALRSGLLFYAPDRLPARVLRSRDWASIPFRRSAVEAVCDSIDQGRPLDWEAIEPGHAGRSKACKEVRAFTPDKA